ncbi:MAG TPA: spermatid nuclear transition protein 1 family protein, partial [Paraprevotella xylaniphila]|nr:spermatid nuclear transition protein 1 family protein [Paraprevotella xylaniphila]
CAKRKINRRRLKNRLAQNENPISEDGSECV